MQGLKAYREFLEHLASTDSMVRTALTGWQVQPDQPAQQARLESDYPLEAHGRRRHSTPPMISWHLTVRDLLPSIQTRTKTQAPISLALTGTCSSVRARQDHQVLRAPLVLLDQLARREPPAQPEHKAIKEHLAMSDLKDSRALLVQLALLGQVEHCLPA